MLILDKPYVSEFLKKTAEDMKIPLLDNGHIFDITQSKNLKLLSEDEFLGMTGTRNPLKLYCNSEKSSKTHSKVLVILLAFRTFRFMLKFV